CRRAGSGIRVITAFLPDDRMKPQWINVIGRSCVANDRPVPCGVYQGPRADFGSGKTFGVVDCPIVPASQIGDLGSRTVVRPASLMVHPERGFIPETQIEQLRDDAGPRIDLVSDWMAETFNIAFDTYQSGILRRKTYRTDGWRILFTKLFDC